MKQVPKMPVTDDLYYDGGSSSLAGLETEERMNERLGGCHDDEQFEALLEQLGVRDCGNDEALRAMWENLTSDPNPEMMAAFEEVLAKLTGDLQRKSAERQDLETTLKMRNKTQEEHLQHLYEEMEQQIQR